MSLTRKILSIFTLSIIFCYTNICAQQSQLNTSQQFRLADRLIRVAEPGQLADSVNVWGDVGTSGRYLIPKKTTLAELLSYSGGMGTLRDGQTQLDWSKMRIEVNVHYFNLEERGDDPINFTFRFEEPFPFEMNEFVLQNGQIITVRVKRKPSFRDYLGIFASTISAVASTIILLDRLNQN